MVTIARDAMRTRFEIVLADPEADPANLRAAGEEALAEIERVETLLSAYRPDADLYAVNAWAGREPVRVEPTVLEFLERARTLSARTFGAFDMTVGPLLRCWSLEGDAAGKVPSQAEISAARALVGMDDARLRLDTNAGTAALVLPGARLDPGAIGKGYALERAADLLREAGVRSALLHGGTSTVCALDAARDSPDGWKIALQHPRLPDARLAQVVLRNNALSVSAVHGKSFWAQGRRFGHVLDPRTGWPVAHSVLAAVIAPSPTDTDAVSTALLVLGPEGIAPLARAFPEAGFLIAFDESDNESGLSVQTHGDGWQVVDFLDEEQSKS